MGGGNLADLAWCQELGGRALGRVARRRRRGRGEAHVDVLAHITLLYSALAAAVGHSGNNVPTTDAPSGRWHALKISPAVPNQFPPSECYIGTVL